MTTFAEMMRLEPHGPDTFVGTGPRYPWGGLYGGQIVAQALRAASLTVEGNYRVHSLHAYFIRLGDASEPIRLEVDRIRNGRSFLTRRVVARQSVGAILNLAASFHVAEDWVDVQIERMPAVPPPEQLTGDSWSPLMERRLLEDKAEKGRVAGWMRLAEPLGEDPAIHACALAYLSDDLPTDAVVTAHPERPPERTPGFFWTASLDHAMWFHRPFRADEWHLHQFTCRGLIGTRGLSIGAIFDRSGRQIASVAQEVLIRRRREN
ncbi:MAG: acyl-CoA thioesterase II [Candidatus Binatia bacterium]|nr:MAG: acyl-CoA thioesterase II [Candidatus Binatia bacterium]